jgi:hypothetical protein
MPELPFISQPALPDHFDQMVAAAAPNSSASDRIRSDFVKERKVPCTGSISYLHTLQNFYDAGEEDESEELTMNVGAMQTRLTAQVDETFKCPLTFSTLVEPITRYTRGVRG